MKITQTNKIFTLLLIIVIIVQCQNNKKCCNSYDRSNTLCLTCPDGTYFYGNNCIMDIDYCQQYNDCFVCMQCALGYKLIDVQYNGQTIKKCQIIQPQYLQLDINNKTQQDQNYQAYLISDDYMRSFHKQVKKSKILHVYVYNKKINNTNSNRLSIQNQYYNEETNKYYRTVMEIQFNKYQFKEISFQEIGENLLKSNIISKNKYNNNNNNNKSKQPIDISSSIGTITNYDGYIEKILDLRQVNNLKIIQAVDVIARGSNTIYKKIVGVKIKSSKDSSVKNKDIIEISYQLSSQNTMHTIAIQASTRRVVTINGNSVYGNGNSSVISPTNTTDNKQIINSNGKNEEGTQKLSSDKNNQKPVVSNPVLPAILPIVLPTPTPTTLLTSISPANPAPASPNVLGSTPTSTLAPASAPTITTTPTPTTTTTPTITPTPAPVSIPSPATVPIPTSAPSPSQTTATTPSPTPTPSLNLTNNSQSPKNNETKPSQNTNAQTKVVTPPPTNSSDLWPKQPVTGYTSETNLELLKDLKFLVVKDFINKKLTGYQDLLPSSSFTKTQGDTKIYLMTFNKQEQGIQTEILSKIKIATYIPELIFERKVALIPKELPKQTNIIIYTEKDLNQIKKSSFYIPAAIQATKANSGYSSDNLVSTSTNQDEPNIIYYRSVYNLSGKIWQVQTLTKKKLRIGQFISQKDITPPINNVNKLTNEKSTPSTNINILPQQKPLQQTPTPPASTPNQNTTQPMNNITIVNKQPQYSGSSEKPATPAVNSTSAPENQYSPKQKNQNPIVPTPPISTPPSGTKQTSNQNSGQKNSKPQKICELPKSTPKIQQILKFAQVTQLSTNILGQIGGFTQIPLNEDKPDISFLKVQSYIQCAQNKELKESKIIAAFQRVFGFSVQYKIFYEAPKRLIFQAYAAMDRLKNRVYIVNFNPISFGFL